MANWDKSNTQSKATEKPVPNPVRFTMMLISVCLVYTGIAFGDGIYDYIHHLPISKRITDALVNLQPLLNLKFSSMAGLVKATIITLYLLPVFTVGCLLITRRNKYLKISAIPFLSFSVGILLKYLFGWSA